MLIGWPQKSGEGGASARLDRARPRPFWGQPISVDLCVPTNQRWPWAPRGGGKWPWERSKWAKLTCFTTMVRRFSATISHISSNDMVTRIERSLPTGLEPMRRLKQWFASWVRFWRSQSSMARSPTSHSLSSWQRTTIHRTQQQGSLRTSLCFVARELLVCRC